MMGMFCRKCKSLMPPNSKRCIACGATLNPNDISNQSSLDGLGPKRKPVELVAEENKDAPYLPYKPRGCQLDIISDIRMALDEGRHIIIESGTGTGKTIVSLSAGLEHAKKTGKKIVYLTRTISQSNQVMRELKAISKIKPVSGLTITGRNKSCPLFRGTKDYESLSPKVLSMMCEEKRSKSMKGAAGGCRYFDRIKTEVDDVTNYVMNNFPTSDELDRYCEKNGVCPYEMKKQLMKKFDVVAVPYVHILSADIRSNLMANLDLEDNPEGMLLIVDEAHNLVDAARDQESFIINRDLVDNAIDECSTMKGDPTVWMEVTLKDFLGYFKNSIRNVATEKLGLNEKEVVLTDDYIEQRMMTKFGMKSQDLESAIERVIDFGEARTEILMERGDNRVSDIQSLGFLMRDWCSSASDRFVRSLKVDQDGEYLSAKCIDPYEISFFLNSIPGAIHMSGTLQPLDQYARVLGLKGNPRFRIYPSPFPPENRSVLYVNDVTTQQKEMQKDGSMQHRLENYIAMLCNSVQKNTLVFFTSYSFMRMMRPYLETHVNKSLYWEESRNQRKTMENLAAFRNGRDGVFFSVMGGSVAEGMDFPGDELCFAIIVGIPYPPPSSEQRAMSAMFDQRYGAGKGWIYTSEVPALRKMKQAIGRLIRTETDRGMAVILDNRASRYVKQLDAKLTDDPAGEATRFFR
ncbi:MAG: ATP-dependent DNA helicase [Candidatus Methanomethylophilaceae archaeon]|nr:ATP-dependent DNA helicase [Candidatus Methanomethylophilaceae archaeon]